MKGRWEKMILRGGVFSLFSRFCDLRLGCSVPPGTECLFPDPPMTVGTVGGRFDCFWFLRGNQERGASKGLWV